MEGIKEAIAFITGLAVKAEKPEVVQINGRTYCTKDLRRYDAADKAEAIKATTLTSLVDYIKESREELRDRMIIQVISATKVLLYSGLLPERDRETLFEVNALLPQFEYMAGSTIRRVFSSPCNRVLCRARIAKLSLFWRAISPTHKSRHTRTMESPSRP